MQSSDNDTLAAGDGSRNEPWEQRSETNDLTHLYFPPHSYRILGLLPTLNPRQSGGIEPVEGVPYAISSAASRPVNIDDLDERLDDGSDDSDDDDMNAEGSTSKATIAPKALAKGEGRIVRDATGKITGIVMGGEDGVEVTEAIVAQVRDGEDSDSDDEESDEEEEVEEEVEVENLQTPWGNEMEDWDGEGADADRELEDEKLSDYLKPRSTGQGIPIGAKRERIIAKTDIVARESAYLSVPLVSRSLHLYYPVQHATSLHSVIERYTDLARMIDGRIGADCLEIDQDYSSHVGYRE